MIAERKGRHHHGWCKTKTYRAWAHMLDRCNNSKANNYSDYGGRGIRVCNRWNYFENFLEDIGPMPEKLTLERIDNDGNYNPENCKWSDYICQARNQRSVRKSASGHRGVRPYGKSQKRWQAYIYIGDKWTNLGIWDTVEAALAARKLAEMKYWGIKPNLDKRIPKYVRAGSLNFKVHYPHIFKERSDINGRIMFDEELILIGNTAESGSPCTKNHAWRVFWHEATHILNKVYCSEGLGTEMDMETLTDSLAFGIAQLLNDNFYVIPK